MRAGSRCVDCRGALVALRHCPKGLAHRSRLIERGSWCLPRCLSHQALVPVTAREPRGGRTFRGPILLQDGVLGIQEQGRLCRLVLKPQPQLIGRRQVEDSLAQVITWINGPFMSATPQRRRRHGRNLHGGRRPSPLFYSSWSSSSVTAMAMAMAREWMSSESKDRGRHGHPTLSIVRGHPWWCATSTPFSIHTASYNCRCPSCTSFVLVSPAFSGILLAMLRSRPTRNRQVKLSIVQFWVRSQNHARPSTALGIDIPHTS
jgi:hypothetical protein